MRDSTGSCTENASQAPTGLVTICYTESLEGRDRVSRLSVAPEPAMRTASVHGDKPPETVHLSFLEQSPNILPKADCQTPGPPNQPAAQELQPPLLNPSWGSRITCWPVLLESPWSHGVQDPRLRFQHHDHGDDGQQHFLTAYQQSAHLM